MSYQHRRLLGKQNFTFVWIGVALILVGFVIMAGGGTTDPNVYPEATLYGFRRTVLAPVVILLGFLLQLVAIWYKTDVPVIASSNTAATKTSTTSATTKKSGTKSGR